MAKIVCCRDFCLFVYSIFTLPLTNGLMFENFKSNKCSAFDDDVILFGVPYHQCVYFCNDASECVAVSYKQQMSVCKLHLYDNTTLECTGYLYTKKADWTAEDSECDCTALHQLCSSKGICSVQDWKCPRPSTPDFGSLLGNMYSKDKSTNVMCNPGYVVNGSRQNTCQDGNWTSGEVTCVEDPNCNNYLIGGENGVDDSQLSESSNFCNLNPSHGNCSASETYTACVNSRIGSTGHYTGGWYPGYASTTEYIQVDFQRRKVVSSILVQGRDPVNYTPQYVTSFKIKLSDDCKTFSTVKDANGSDKIFDGTSGGDAIVVRPLPERKRARCVRLHPETWSAWPSLRWDIQGC